MTSRDQIKVTQLKVSKEKMQEAMKRASENVKSGVVWKDTIGGSMDENTGHIQETSDERRIRTAEVQGATFLDKANALVVQGDEDFEAAAATQVHMKEWVKRAEAFMDPMVDAAYASHKVLTTQRKELIGPVKAAIKIYARKMGLFQEEMERERVIAQQVLQAEADKLAQEEADAAAAMVADDNPELAAVIAENVVAPVVEVESIAPKYAGTAVRTTWKHRIVDASAIPREWMTPDEKAIGAHGRAKKGEAKIAGVEFYGETNVN